MTQEKKPLQQIAEIKPEDIRNYVLLLDIDGVVCEPQRPISEDMAKVINLIHYKNSGHVYYCTGNHYTKALDLVGGGKIFACNGYELREDGRQRWQSNDDPLPLDVEKYLWERLQYHGHTSYGNCIEWRSPSFINFSTIGRYAPLSHRLGHVPVWQDAMKEHIETQWSNVCVSKGAVSIDIYTKGADKSRAGKYVNEVLQKPFIFIGDKTAPGGNDYPLVKYCEDSGTFPNIALTTTGTPETMTMLDKIYRML